MARKNRNAFMAVVALIVLAALSLSHYQLGGAPIVSSEDLHPTTTFPLYSQSSANRAILEEDDVAGEDEQLESESTHLGLNPRDDDSVSGDDATVSILLPNWEVLVITPPGYSPELGAENFTCLFPNNDTSPANPSGVVPSPERATYKCGLPRSLRRRPPFPQPVLINSESDLTERVKKPEPPELLWWKYLVYDSYTTENDVIVFVKGLNNRQGINRPANQFRCVFGDDAAITTAVTSSIQEVFRCERPELTAVSGNGGPIKISISIPERNQPVPSVAYYVPKRKIANPEPKSLLCACTMVHNVAKFLPEWVVYHAGIGVGKFFLYDNDSDDDLGRVVEELNQQGYDVRTNFWVWPKTQEAGFSHCAVQAKDSCSWMMFTDVDEFVYSPTWVSSNISSEGTLHSLLPESGEKIGQIMVGCHEFGPSNQKSHPPMGVTQGYNCRQQSENRHKSIVLLEAIDDSLLNVIHHFRLKLGYSGTKLGIQEAVVNHYKFQAWSEFKAKFRRRVSAYVVDWTQAVNLASKDRTPGLGHVPVEPEGWPEKFCEVVDDELKELTKRWFSVDDDQSPSGYQMAWQR